MRFVDPDTGETSSYVTNSEGWKDSEHQFAKPAGVFRILFLGDSITFGQVRPDDLYTYRVRDLLVERQEANIEIISIGVGAWGTDQILEVLTLEGLKYDPDLVIYQLNPNDLTDNLSPTDGCPQDNIRWNKPFRYEIRNHELVKIALGSPQQSNPISKALTQSAIIHNLARVIGALQNTLETIRGVPEANINWWERYPIHPTAAIRYYAGEQSAEMQDAWELIEGLILEMKRTAESNGARFIAYTTAGDEGYRQWNLDHGWLHTDPEGDFILWEDSRYPVNWYLQLERIDQIAARHDIPLIKPVRSYHRYQNDAHPNANGNLSMALDIVDYLMEWESTLSNGTAH